MPCIRRFTYALLLTLSVSLLIPVTTSAAQGRTRLVEGTVSDQNNSPIDGAVVQLKNLATLQIRSYITSADGKYRFAGLDGAYDYELVAQYKGRRSDTRMLSRFDSRTEPVIDLQISLSR